MPCRNRLPVLVLGGCLAASLIGSAALAQDGEPPAEVGDPVAPVEDQANTGGAEDHSEEKDQSAHEVASALDKIESAIRDHIAHERQAQSQPPADHEVRDLYAQESMARWTKGMFWASVIAVALTFTGLVLLWRTLGYTKSAAISAKDAAEYTRQAVTVASETAQRELRAYVLIDYAKYVYLKTFQSWAIEIQIRNFGQTPAHDLKTKVDYAISNNPIVEFPEPKHAPPAADLAPGHYFATPVHMLKTVEDQVFTPVGPNVDKETYLWGQISYRDVFGHSRETHFRLVHTDPSVYEFGFCDEGNRST